MNSVTSATLRAGRPELPAKMTSSTSLPRIEEGRVSPITQRMASNRLDLPQPFGPITAVRPGSTKSSVGSTKDLKPESLRRVNFNFYVLVSTRLVLLGEFFVQKLRKRVEWQLRIYHAVHDEGRGAGNVVPGFPLGGDFVDGFILSFGGPALLGLIGPPARDSRHQKQPGMDIGPRILIHVPFGLILEQQVNEREVLIL